MEQQTSVQEAPAQVVPSIIPQVQIEESKPVDLIDKVSQFKKNQSVAKPVQENGESFFDYKEIDKITDPVARKFAEDAYKSMQSGFTKKTQEIAEQKRQFDQKVQEMQNWSPDRIQRELLNNPQFIQAAQQVAQLQNPVNSGLTDEQFSALTPSEKAELAQVPTLKNEINQLKQVNYQAIISQRDSQLQAKYSDYNPIQINDYLKKLSELSPVDIREHAYKAYKHDEDVAAAYELGKQEAKSLNQTKINAITPTGNSATTSEGLPTREKGDTDQMYFTKLANFRLAEFKNRK